MERMGGDSLLSMFPHFSSKYIECMNLNNYFSTVAEEITGASHIERLNQLTSGMPVNNIHQNHKHPYPGIKFRHTSTKEIEKL